MSYSDTLETDLDKLRAWIGDTSNDPSTELLTDDHIEAVLALYPPFATALAFLADELAVRFAQKPGSVTLPSGLSVSWAERVKAWQAIAANARKGVLTAAASVSLVPVSYGVSTTPGEFARPSIWWP